MKTVVSIVGARPQFIKAGPISKALEAAGVRELLVHTGQHYDPAMSEDIMKSVGLRVPDVNLGVGSGSHGAQTGRILEGVEEVLLANDVSAVLVYGDTNSTVAGSLAAVKLGMFTGHVEAGLRSFNRDMPEEINRMVTDHVSDALYAPTHTAMTHLDREGLTGRALLTGDVMVDALRTIDLSLVTTPEWARGEFYSATIHRAENTDDGVRLNEIITALNELDAPVHLLAHPRLRRRLEEFRIETGTGSLQLHAPLGYAEMLASIAVSRGVFTDSGGLQKEACIVGTPCVTIRNETEWPETLVGGWNVLANPGDDLVALVRRPVEPRLENPFGDGEAATRIVGHLVATL